LFCLLRLRRRALGTPSRLQICLLTEFGALSLSFERNTFARQNRRRQLNTFFHTGGQTNDRTTRLQGKEFFLHRNFNSKRREGGGETGRTRYKSSPDTVKVEPSDTDIGIFGFAEYTATAEILHRYCQFPIEDPHSQPYFDSIGSRINEFKEDPDSVLYSENYAIADSPGREASGRYRHVDTDDYQVVGNTVDRTSISGNWPAGIGLKEKVTIMKTLGTGSTDFF